MGTHRNVNTAGRKVESGGAEAKRPANVCEICGREMERDPESGEYYCADCYYSENEV